MVVGTSSESRQQSLDSRHLQAQMAPGLQIQVGNTCHARNSDISSVLKEMTEFI